MTKTAVALPQDGQTVPVQTGNRLAALVPADMDQAWRMARMIAASGMAPKDMQRPEAIVTAIFHGLEIGLKPMQAIQSIAIVNGRPTIWGDAAMGLVQGSGLLVSAKEWLEAEGDEMTAHCQLERIGWAEPIHRTFSVADAKAASLWTKGGPWKQYPKRMLQMRARSFALRDGFADCLKGLQLREEVRDYAASGISAQPITGVSAGEIINRQRATFVDSDAITIDEPAPPQADPQPPADTTDDDGDPMAAAVAMDGRIKAATPETIDAVTDDAQRLIRDLDDGGAEDMAGMLRAALKGAQSRVRGDGDLLGDR